MFSITDRIAGSAAAFSGAMMIAGGITQVVHPLWHPRLVGLTAHLLLSFFVAGWLTMWPAIIALGRRARPGRASRNAAVAAAAAVIALGLVSLTSVIHGDDLPLFPFVAAPANAAWLLGALVLCVSLVRAGEVPRPIAVGLPLSWLLVIPLSHMGGAVLAGVWLGAVALLLSAEVRHDTRPRSVTASA